MTVADDPADATRWGHDRAGAFRRIALKERVSADDHAADRLPITPVCQLLTFLRMEPSTTKYGVQAHAQQKENIGDNQTRGVSKSRISFLLLH